MKTVIVRVSRTLNDWTEVELFDTQEEPLAAPVWSGCLGTFKKDFPGVTVNEEELAANDVVLVTIDGKVGRLECTWEEGEE